MNILGVGILLSALCFAQTYQPTWDSVDKRPTPQWFSDSKFGIFIHWGVYSVPAYGPVGKYAEWYWNALSKGPIDNGKPNPTFDFHKRVYGENFAYADFAPTFRAELYDPAHWAESLNDRAQSTSCSHRSITTDLPFGPGACQQSVGSPLERRVHRP